MESRPIELDKGCSGAIHLTTPALSWAMQPGREARHNPGCARNMVGSAKSQIASAKPQALAAKGR